MRTTVNLDDDAYVLASAHALAWGMTLGAAIGDLVRLSQRTAEPRACTIAENGLPIFASTGRTITLEMIKALEEEDDLARLPASYFRKKRSKR